MEQENTGDFEEETRLAVKRRRVSSSCPPNTATVLDSTEWESYLTAVDPSKSILMLKEALIRKVPLEETEAKWLSGVTDCPLFMDEIWLTGFVINLPLGGEELSTYVKKCASRYLQSVNRTIAVKFINSMSEEKFKSFVIEIINSSIFRQFSRSKLDLFYNGVRTALELTDNNRLILLLRGKFSVYLYF